MKSVDYQPSWADSWKSSWQYDIIENSAVPVQPIGYWMAYQNRLNRTLETLKSTVPKSSKILDIAAAQGNFSLRMAELGYEVTWNDLRAELIDYVKLKHDTGILHFLPGNVFELNLTEKYDLVLICEVIEHVAHPDVFLKSISALCKPGGFVLLTTPNGSYFQNKLPRFSDCPDPEKFESQQFKPNSDGHIFLLHPDEISSLAHNSELVVLEHKLFTSFITNGHLLTHHLLSLLPHSWIFVLESFSQQLPFFLRRLITTHMLILMRKESR